MTEDLSIFLDEAKELLDEIEHNLMAAEKRPEDWSSLIGVAFGSIHTIKGNSLYLELNDLAQCCQKIESFLAQEDRSPRLPKQEEFDILFQFIDIMRDYFLALSDEEDMEEQNKKLSEWLAKI